MEPRLEFGLVSAMPEYVGIDSHSSNLWLSHLKDNRDGVSAVGERARGTWITNQEAECVLDGLLSPEPRRALQARAASTPG